MTEFISRLNNELDSIDWNSNDKENTSPEYEKKLTDFLLKHPEVNLIKDLQSLNISEKEDGTVEITTDTGESVNSLLPHNIAVVFSPTEGEDANDYYAYPAVNTIEIPRSFIDEGMSARIWLAHEVGHILDPDSTERVKRMQELEEQIDIVQAGEECLNLVIEYCNLELELEVEAFNHGKALSQVLGIDELVYEDIANAALNDRVQWAKTYIAEELEEMGGVSNQTHFQLYNVSLQERSEVTREEFLEFIAKADEEKSEKILKHVDENLKRKQ